MRRALSLDPTFAAAHNNLGVTLHPPGRRAEAFAAYQRAAALDPGDQTAAKNIRALARQQQVSSARMGAASFPVGSRDRRRARARRCAIAMNWTRSPRLRGARSADGPASDVARVAMLALVGTAATVWAGSVATRLVTAGLHPSPTPSGSAVPPVTRATPEHPPSRLRGVSDRSPHRRNRHGVHAGANHLLFAGS